MSLPAFAVRRPIAACMVLLAAILLGVVSWTRLPVALLPEIAGSHLAVWIAYPGAGVLEVEESVARPAEEAVVSARGVRDVRSTVVPGGVSLTVLLQEGSDPEVVALGVRERLDAMRWALPAGVERPVLLGTGSGDRPDLVLALAADDLSTAARWSEAVLQKRLEQIDGVARAQVVGAPKPEITVQPDARALATTGVSVSELARVIREANVTGAGGTLRRRGIRYALHVESELTTAQEVRDVVVRTTGDRVLRVSDLATVTEGYEIPEGWSRLDDAPAVGILVFRESGANLVTMAQRVQATLTLMGDEFPAFDIAVIADPSPYVKQAIGGVTQAVWIGGLLAFVILVVFLREVRSPLYLALALPASVIPTFAVLETAGVGLNLMSLGGLALGIGMLVDNSIICLENIHRLRGEGLPADEAAIRGAEEVSLPMLASTLTSMAVFIPLALVPGTVGTLFRDQAITVSASLAVSLGVALTLLPMLAGRLAPGAFREGVLPFYGTYHTVLLRSLRRPVTALAAIGLLLMAGLVTLGQRPREILPALDTDLVQVELRLPPGTDVDGTDTAVRVIESWLGTQSGVAHVFSAVGATGAANAADPGERQSRAQVRIRLESDGARDRRQILAGLLELGERHPEWNLSVVEDRPELAALFPPTEPTLRLEILGGDVDVSEALAREVAVAAQDALLASGLGLRVSAAETEPRLAYVPRDDVLWQLGLAEMELFQAVSARGTGVEATTVRRFDEEIPVRIRIDDGGSPESGFLVAGGRSYTVRDLFDVRLQQTPARVVREQQRRLAAVRWDGELRDADAVKEALEAGLAEVALPPGTTWRFGGTWKTMQTTLADILKAFGLSAGLVLLILAAQFESLKLPLLIFAAVPLALVGIAVALLISGGSLNAFSGIGFVVLVGIVVNDSILKVDLLRSLTAAGVPTRDAVLTASRQRYRPILMTTLTTTLALVPVFFSGGQEFLAPLAATVIGGLASGTLLTLFVIPVLFTLLQRGAAAAAQPMRRAS